MREDGAGTSLTACLRAQAGFLQLAKQSSESIVPTGRSGTEIECPFHLYLRARTAIRPVARPRTGTAWPRWAPGQPWEGGLRRGPECAMLPSEGAPRPQGLPCQGCVPARTRRPDSRDSEVTPPCLEENPYSCPVSAAGDAEKVGRRSPGARHRTPGHHPRSLKARGAWPANEGLGADPWSLEEGRASS